MQTPEEAAREYVDDRWKRSTEDGDAQDLADLIRSRDEAIRADERGRCSVVHATLTDEALVAELVRRGVLEVDEYAEPCGWRSHPLPHGAAHDVWAGNLRSHPSALAVGRNWGMRLRTRHLSCKMEP